MVMECATIMKKKYIILLSALLIYTFFGFFIVPVLVKDALYKGVKEYTYMNIHVDDISFNPFVMKLCLDKVRLNNKHNKSLFDAKELLVDIDLYTLFLGKVGINEITLQNPRLHIRRLQDKQFELTTLLQPQKSSKESSKESTQQSDIIPLQIGHIRLQKGVVSFEDLSKKDPFRYSIEKLDFDLYDVDTTRKKGIGHISLALLGEDGTSLQVTTLLDSLQPIKIKGDVDLNNTQLYTPWRYLQEQFNFEVADGLLDIHTEFATNLDELNTTTLSNTQLYLQHLRLKPKKTHKNLLFLQSLDIYASSIAPIQHTGIVDSVTLDGLQLAFKKSSHGAIDWQHYFSGSSKKEKQPQKEDTNETSVPWDITLKKIALHNIDTTFDDYSVAPHVVTRIENLDIDIGDFNTLLDQNFWYKIAFAINKKGRCSLDGKGKLKTLSLMTHTQCSNFDVVDYKPYITQYGVKNFKRFDIDLRSLQSNFSIDTNIYDANKSTIIDIEDGNFSLNKCLVYKRSAKSKLVRFKKFHIANAHINTATKKIVIDDIVLQRAVAYVQRYSNGRLSVDNLVIPKKTRHIKKPQKQKPFHIIVKTIHIKNGALYFYDASTHPHAKEYIENITLTLHNYDSKKWSWMRYKGSLRVNKKGRVYYSGRVRHTPLRQSGTVYIKNIALHDINPYVKDATYLDITDGFLSVRAKESYFPRKGASDVMVKGSFSIDSLFINNVKDNTLLFSMNKLRIPSYTFELAPDRLYIKSVDIDSFYVDAKVDEHRVLNFSQLVKPVKTKRKKTKKKTKQKKSQPFNVQIAQLNVHNGSAKFSDFSIPIKFQTDIHDLNGVIYAISTMPQETTYLDIKGEVDKYGSTTLKGSLDSSNPKKFTDIDFKFNNLALHSLSGYSAEFAGYKIDDGKLFLDLGYDIKDGQLQGSNSVVIKKIKLGDEIDDENVTHLPLGLVVALLEDSNGIIDIDMPVEGNINNPDFKYGALIWKTFTNLIAKAVTSPFRFLGSMLGIDADKLEHITFDAGKSFINPPEREKIDQLITLLNKRPKLALKVQGGYNIVKDLEALQTQKLIAILVEQSGEKDVKDKQSLLTADLLEDLYEQYYGEEQLDKLEEKLHKKYTEGSFKRAYQQALIHATRKKQKVSSKELRSLAQKRAYSVYNYILQKDPKMQGRIEINKEIYKAKEDEGNIVKFNITTE